MEYRQLGSSGLRVPVLSFGAGTFGGKGPCSAPGAQATPARRGGWSTSASTPASRCSTPPTSIRTAHRNRCSARRSRGGAMQGPDLDQDRPADGRRPARLRARRGRASIAAVDAALRRLGTDYGSTCSSFTPSTPPRRPRRCCRTLDTARCVAGKLRYVGRLELSPAGRSDEGASARRAARLAAPMWRTRSTIRWSAATYESDLMPLAARPGRRRAGLEPARLGPPHRQDRARPAAPERAAASMRPLSSGRPSTTSSSTAIVDALDAVAAETGKHRAPGRDRLAAAPARPCRPSSSARATRRSCATISVRSAGR
jgi:aryl-alcohol dehydrogenase-like predicted oxidoreductase